KKDFYRSEHQKRKDEFCPFSSLADFNPLQLTKSHKKRVDNLVSTPESLLKQKPCQRIFGRVFGRKLNKFISF
ncbi:hypothetical protein, partial [Streptococcus pneumoniae]|uniref:hypothetical protein n=1 Tax=Streptococcus pneumoniae TaxID=1313 RepID=UPI001E417EB3